MKLLVVISSFFAAFAVAAPTPGPGNGSEPFPPGLFNTTLAVTGTAIPSSGYNSAVYFANWGVYATTKDFPAQKLPVDKINRVLYAFANILPDGTVTSSDSWGDLGIHYPTDSWSEPGNNAYGSVKQIFRLKQQNRHLKVLLSIGGWTFSPQVKAAAATAATRETFATSAVRMMGDWGFDGLDIDWEYPETAAEARNLVLLLQACRRALDAYAQRTTAPPYHFLLTVASPAGPAHYSVLDLPAMDALVDAWHLMAYDYAGRWDKTTGHAANLYPNPAQPLATKFNTDQAVAAYHAAGVPPRKLQLGLPLYGQTFLGTAGLGQPYERAGGVIGPDGEPSGQWPYRILPRPGAAEYYDATAEATYSYDAATRELVSYDAPAEVGRKAAYAAQQGFGGTFFWEASGDAAGDRSLVSAVAARLGPLDRSPNLLSYPASQYDNIRKGTV